MLDFNVCDTMISNASGNRIMRLTSAIKDAGYLGKLSKMPFYAKSYPIDPVRYDAGYVLYDPKTSAGEYRYYIRDHLGNVRVESFW